MKIFGVALGVQLAVTRCVQKYLKSEVSNYVTSEACFGSFNLTHVPLCWCCIFLQLKICTVRFYFDESHSISVLVWLIFLFWKVFVDVPSSRTHLIFVADSSCAVCVCGFPQYWATDTSNWSHAKAFPKTPQQQPEALPKSRIIRWSRSKENDHINTHMLPSISSKSAKERRLFLCQSECWSPANFHVHCTSLLFNLD